MHVTIPLSTDVAQTEGSPERQHLLDPFDLALKPLHAGSEDPPSPPPSRMAPGA